MFAPNALQFLFFIGIFLIVMPETRAQCPIKAKSAQTRLRETLLCNYDKMSRPVKHYSQQIKVLFTMDLKRVGMDEHRQSMELAALFRFWWKDEFLVWTPTDYDNTTYIRVDDFPIWLPDLSVNIINNVGIEDLRPSQCTVMFNGDVSCLPRISFSAPCDQNVRRWPFERHECQFTISSFLYYDHQLTLADGTVTQRDLISNREWDVKNISVIRKTYNFPSNGTVFYYPLIAYKIIVDRHAGFYAAGTVLPALMLLITVLNTFFMGTMLSSRLIILGFVTMCCSTFLSYLMYLVTPNGDVVPVIVTLFRDCLVLSTFAMIIATIVKALSVSEGIPPLWLTSITDRVELSILGRILFLTNATPPQDDEASIIESPTKTKLWAAHAILLDRISFLCCFIVTSVLLAGYLPY